MVTTVGKGAPEMSDDDSVRLAINDLLALTQTTAKNLAEPANVRTYAATINERLRALAKMLPAHVHVDGPPAEANRQT
jgi:hypothetical protein